MFDRMTHQPIDYPSYIPGYREYLTEFALRRHVKYWQWPMTFDAYVEAELAAQDDEDEIDGQDYEDHVRSFSHSSNYV